MSTTLDPSNRSKNGVVDEDDCEMFQFIVDKYVIRFAAAGYPEEHREWFVEILGKRMQEIYDRAYEKGRREVIDGIHEALEISLPRIR